MHTNEEYVPFKPKDYENGTFEDTETYQTSSGPLWRSIQLRVRILWVLLGFSLLFNAFVLLRDIRVLHTHGVEEDTFGAGFQTDFRPARSAIRTHKVLFEGSPRFHPNGTMYYPGLAQNQPRYIGEPSQEIDDNWEALTKARYWALSEDEAIETFGAAEYRKYWDPTTQGYIAGSPVGFLFPGSTHSILCINFLRKSFYPNYYSDMSPVHGIIHRDHCIDHLRQLVQCQGDITPIPTRFREGIDRNYIDSDRWHTCRDWSYITQWVDKRYTESRKVIAEQTNGKVNWVP